MDTDKENISRMSAKSRIPLPLDPLPALSENILKTRRCSENERRQPLKAINNQQIHQSDSAGPSKKVKKLLNTSIHPLKLDTRHVTLRPRSEDLDWDYKVFKDKYEDENNNNIIVISSSSSSSDDNEDNIQRNTEKDVKYFIGKNQICVKSTTTPVQHLLEPMRVRNIKKSLKRPHSRELQGISEAEKENREEAIKLKRRLISHERLQDRLESPDYFKKLYTTCLVREYTWDMYEYLVSSEGAPTIPRIASVTRACVINWLMKVNGADGDPTIVQTACWYLDAVLSVGSVQLNKLQLVAAACYWISQKLHGPSVQASKLVKCANRAFTAEELMATEKAIMLKLKFPRHPVVPQDFITYLSWCCDNNRPGEIEVAATFICMSALMVNKALCTEYPSVIGAAAVRNALILLKRMDLITRLQKCPLFKKIEKKTSSMYVVCSVQRKAVRLMGVTAYEYKAPLEQYGSGPYFLAYRVLRASNEIALRSRNQQGLVDMSIG